MTVTLNPLVLSKESGQEVRHGIILTIRPPMRRSSPNYAPF